MFLAHRQYFTPPNIRVTFQEEEHEHLSSLFDWQTSTLGSILLYAVRYLFPSAVIYDFGDCDNTKSCTVRIQTEDGQIVDIRAERLVSDAVGITYDAENYDIPTRNSNRNIPVRFASQNAASPTGNMDIDASNNSTSNTPSEWMTEDWANDRLREEQAFERQERMRRERRRR